MTCSPLGYCYLISPSQMPRSTAVAIICRLTRILHMSTGDTGTLRSAIGISAAHPSRTAAAQHTAARHPG